MQFFVVVASERCLFFVRVMVCLSLLLMLMYQ